MLQRSSGSELGSVPVLLHIIGIIKLTPSASGVIAPLSSVLVPTCPLITFGARVRSGKEGRRQEVGVFWTMVASSDWTYCSSLLYNISMIYVSLWQLIFSMKQLVSIYKQDKETQNIERLWKFCCGR